MGDVLQFPLGRVNDGKPTPIDCPHCGNRITREGFKTWSFWCKDGSHGDLTKSSIAISVTKEVFEWV